MQSEIGINQLNHHLAQWQGRRRLRDLLIWGPRGLLIGLLAAVLLAAVARFRPLLTNSEVGYAAGICALVGLLGGLLTVFLRPTGRLEQARFADKTFGLRERLTTALQLHDGSIDAPAELRQEQLADSLDAAAAVDPKAGLPLELNLQDLVFILLTVVLLAAAVIIPNSQEQIILQERAVQQVIDEQIEALETLREEILENPELTAEQQDELLQPIDEALQTLAQGDLTQEEALAALSGAEGELRDLAAQNDTTSLREQLAQAGEGLSATDSGGAVGEALQQENLGEAAARLGELAGQLPGMTTEAQQELGRALSEAAQGLQGSDPQLAEQLAEAGTALQQGDVERAQQALQEGQATLEERAQQQAAGEAAGSAAEQLGEGRQEVAQAGQEGQTAEGQQSQPGQSGAQGQQAGQSGQGTEGGQPGASGQVGQDGAEPGGSPAGGTEGGGHTESVFVPPLRDLSQFEGVDVELPAECVDSPENCGFLLDQTPTDFTDEQSIVPYEQVYNEYANTAYEALDEDYVPLGMKNFVRDYFTSLEPNEE